MPKGMGYGNGMKAAKATTSGTKKKEMMKKKPMKGMRTRRASGK